MSVNIRIMQKGFFRRKKFTMEDLIQLSRLSFGVRDENYQLIPNQIGDHTLLFHRKNLQRGIDLYIRNYDICLELDLPASMDEIQLLYSLTRMYCDFMQTNQFVKNDLLMNVKDMDLQMVYDKRTSANALWDLKEKVNDQDSYFEIYGILHPISIGRKEFDYFHEDLDLFGQYLNDKQKTDAYFAIPKIYDVHGKQIGMYALGANIPTILPIKPSMLLKQIDEWYVFINEKIVKYHDLMDFLKKFQYYDANHRVFTLSQEDLESVLLHVTIQNI